MLTLAILPAARIPQAFRGALLRFCRACPSACCSPPSPSSSSHVSHACCGLACCLPAACLHAPESAVLFSHSAFPCRAGMSIHHFSMVSPAWPVCSFGSLCIADPACVACSCFPCARTQEHRDKAFNRVRIPFVAANVSSCRLIVLVPVVDGCLALSVAGWLSGQVAIYCVIVSVFVAVGAMDDAAQQQKAVRACVRAVCACACVGCDWLCSSRVCVPVGASRLGDHGRDFSAGLRRIRHLRLAALPLPAQGRGQRARPSLHHLTSRSLLCRSLCVVCAHAATLRRSGRRQCVGYAADCHCGLLGRSHHRRVSLAGTPQWQWSRSALALPAVRRVCVGLSFNPVPSDSCDRCFWCRSLLWTWRLSTRTRTR